MAGEGLMPAEKLLRGEKLFRGELEGALEEET